MSLLQKRPTHLGSHAKSLSKVSATNPVALLAEILKRQRASCFNNMGRGVWTRFFMYREVATISGLLKMTGLFCKRAL